MKKAIFLDRDGVINKNRNDYVKSVKELEIFPYVGNAIKKLKKMGFIIIVVTNQSAIHQNLTSYVEVKKIHEVIQSFLKKFDTNIDKFYFCPHTPIENCNCRKPNTGLFLKAIDDFNIDPKQSWMIGDSESDIESGRRLSCSIIKVDTKFTLEDAVQKITLLNN